MSLGQHRLGYSFSVAAASIGGWGLKQRDSCDCSGAVGPWWRPTVLFISMNIEKGGVMAQGSRSSRPKTTCCRCRRRAEGVSRLTNLGWLCDHCYELLNRSELGRRLYRLVYQFSGREAGVSPGARPGLSPAPARPAPAAPDRARPPRPAPDQDRGTATGAR